MPTQKKTSKRARPRSSRWRTCHGKYRMVSIAVARRAIVSIAPAPRGGAAAHQGSGGREIRGPGALQPTLVPSLPPRPRPPLPGTVATPDLQLEPPTRQPCAARRLLGLRRRGGAGGGGGPPRRGRTEGAPAERRSRPCAWARLQGRCCTAGQGWRGRRGGGGIDSRTHVHSLAAAVCPPIPP